MCVLVWGCMHLFVCSGLYGIFLPRLVRALTIFLPPLLLPHTQTTMPSTTINTTHVNSGTAMKVEALHVVLLRLLTLLLVGILIIIWVVSHFTFIIKKGTHQFRLPAFSTYVSNIEVNGAARTAL